MNQTERIGRCQFSHLVEWFLLILMFDFQISIVAISMPLVFIIYLADIRARAFKKSPWNHLYYLQRE